MLILAVLVGVGVYSDAGGVVGSSLGDLTGALVGRLEILVPPALVALGVLLIRGPKAPAEPSDEITDGEHRSPALRWLGVGLGMIVLAGLLDLFLAEERTLDEFGFGAYSAGGGLLGAVPGGLALLVGRWGALAVLVLLGLVAASLVSGWSLRQMWAALAETTAPVVHALRDWVSDLFNLGPEVDLTDGAADSSPALFDQDADAPKKAKPKPRKKKDEPVAAPGDVAVVVADAQPYDGDPAKTEQLEIDLGPGGRGLRVEAAAREAARRCRASAAVDTKAVEERGRVLEDALAEHGVETRLVGMTVGPTVTRYELELGAGREGRPGHQPPQGHRLRHGVARRAHPGADPGPPGHRRRGAQPATASSSPSATSSPRPRPRGPRTRSRSPSAATSTARP